MIQEAAAGSDGVIHLAFRHDAMRSGDFAGAVESDLRAVKAIGESLAGTGKPFVIASGTLGLTMTGITGRSGTEHDVYASGPRSDAENVVIDRKSVV